MTYMYDSESEYIHYDIFSEDDYRGVKYREINKKIT